MKMTLAYKTMFHFLEDRYRRLPSDDLGALLGELTLLPDGRPADPAVITEWEQAVQQSVTKDDLPAEVAPMRRRVG